MEGWNGFLWRCDISLAIVAGVYVMDGGMRCGKSTLAVREVDAKGAGRVRIKVAGNEIDQRHMTREFSMALPGSVIVNSGTVVCCGVDIAIRPFSHDFNHTSSSKSTILLVCSY